MHIYTHMLGDMNAGGPKGFCFCFCFVPHQVWKYMPLVYICNLLRSLHYILGLRFIFYYDSVRVD